MYYHPQTDSYFNNQPEKIYFHFYFPINSYKQLLYFYQNL